ncbi:hypothetical protein OAP32_03060, partial [Crocinitomicaceae bacterium]|nr:hypothetical protein [Crocinitomicaceae bacterium]
ATKWHAITGRQYDTSTESEGYSLLTGDVSASTNNVTIGGGLDEQNAATKVAIKVASNVSTRNGTEVVRVTTDGFDVRNNNIRITGTTVIDSNRVVQNVTLGHSNTGARFETNDWMYDTGGKTRFYFEAGGRTFFGSANGHQFRDSGDTTRFNINNYGGVNLLSGGDGHVASNVALAVGGTTVIDSSRNVTE